MKLGRGMFLVGVCMSLFAGMVSFAWGATAQVAPPEPSNVSSLRKSVDAKIDAYGGKMIEMNDWLYKNPESGFLEFKAAELLTGELKKNGFEVEMGVPGLDPKFDSFKIIGGLDPGYKGPKGLPTAFKAKYKGKTERPVIGFMVEYDALRDNPPFHGCQHNQQGPAGLGAAIALARVMEENKIPGSVWVVGTPAEEVGPPSKSVMAQAGYVDGIDVMIRSHGTAEKTERARGGFSPRNIRQMKYTFHGKSSHAQRPWEGVSALDAVMLMFHAVDMMREHSEPQFRFHGVVTDGGTAPNIVPELASTIMWVRHLTDDTKLGNVSPRKAAEMIDKKVIQMDNIAKGAALATGTTVDIEKYGSYTTGIDVGALNDLSFQYGIEYGGVKVDEKPGPPGSWDETGFMSIKMPGVRVAVGVPDCPPNLPGHSMENANVSISPVGHKGLVMTSKVMAAIGLRLATDPEMRKKVQDEFASWVKKFNE